jgi:hypothetical protein
VGRLWYLRRGERITGPFPLPAIQQDFLLGRVRMSDELSEDRLEWLRLSDHPELAALGPPPPAGGAQPGERDWGRERFEALRRWADERSGHDRRTQQEPSASPARRQGERRQMGAPARSGRSTDRGAPSAQPRTAWRIMAAILALVILILVAVAYHFGTVVPVPVRLG